MRMKLRRFLLLLALLNFLGLYSLAEMHHHADEAGEMACAVCHVAAHSAMDVPVPDLSVPVFMLILLFMVSFAESIPLFLRSAVRPRSRSPPTPAFQN